MACKPTILLVDDDEGIASLLCPYLARFNFAAVAAGDAQTMWAAMDAQPVDLILLDLMLPGTDGLALARAVRALSAVPIIMLTARCDPADRIVGLEVGADDYISKPFDPRELVARIQAVLRRSQVVREPAAPSARQNVVSFSGWTLDRDERHLMSPLGQGVPLSNAEYQLLATFLKVPCQVVSRSRLMSEARGRKMSVSNRSIDLLVSRLRQKLIIEDDDGPIELIKTVRGAGYVFDSRPEAGGASSRASAWQAA